MGRKKKEQDEEMMAFLASKSVDQIAEYSQRGRTYGPLSEQRLVETWQNIWNELSVDPVNEGKRDIQADLAAEFALRGAEPPWDLVRQQLEIFLADSDRANEKWRRQNPDAVANANEALAAELDDFVSSRKRSN